MLIAFGGLTGLKALLSFVFTWLMIWKVVVPFTLTGIDPIWLTFSVVAILTSAIIFLVAGVNRRGLTAFTGAITGVLTSCVFAFIFTDFLKINGCVMPFAEVLRYSGYDNLNFSKLYIAAIFFASSGAIMDLSVDISASMNELVIQNPSITRKQAIHSGIRIGRAVVGTMTTTLLLAYSGGYITLILYFTAQKIPSVSFFNYIYFSAEFLKTMAGSIGLILVAPFTAIAGGFILVGNKKRQL